MGVGKGKKYQKNKTNTVFFDLNDHKQDKMSVIFIAFISRQCRFQFVWVYACMV